jgi:hypothetical protein
VACEICRHLRQGPIAAFCPLYFATRSKSSQAEENGASLDRVDACPTQGEPEARVSTQQHHNGHDADVVASYNGPPMTSTSSSHDTRKGRTHGRYSLASETSGRSGVTSEIRSISLLVCPACTYENDVQDILAARALQGRSLLGRVGCLMCDTKLVMASSSLASSSSSKSVPSSPRGKQTGHKRRLPAPPSKIAGTAHSRYDCRVWGLRFRVKG